MAAPGMRKSKDLRSVRPSSVFAVNQMDNYQPWEIETPPSWIGKKCCYCYGPVYGDLIPIGCGNTKEDLLLISACLGTLWGFIVMFLVIVLKGALDSDERHTLLWAFFWAGLSFFFFVGAAVHTGQMQRKTQEDATLYVDQLKAQVQAAKDAGFL